MRRPLYRNNIAGFGTPTLSAATASSLHVAGSIAWYKDGQWGIAYKKSSASSWTYVPTTEKTVDEDLTGLEAETSYDVCLYVKFNNVYQRGTKATATTEAAPEPDPEPEDNGGEGGAGENA